ncbi:PID-CTERM protein-sorting domain-containing protein [Formosa sp. PL04]|uniref:PID-CTERM protein-sorting domain-containing protein n=1 Tax=Formosa sp. PL04 TaxID=3081755 RepID=UPI00298289AA|nr:hypothetical protein [Formosa sp. PL04]MDW5289550.1 hypothetical protein [Formosa sp. PL04]
MQNKTKLILFMLLFTGCLCIAQTLPEPGTPEGRTPTAPGLPIDGGLTVLIAAGAYYGIKKSLKK